MTLYRLLVVEPQARALDVVVELAGRALDAFADVAERAAAAARWAAGASRCAP